MAAHIAPSAKLAARAHTHRIHIVVLTYDDAVFSAASDELNLLMRQTLNLRQCRLERMACSMVWCRVMWRGMVSNQSNLI